MKLLKLYEGVLRESKGEFCVPEIETVLANGKAARPDFIEGIKELKKCVKNYPQILHPEGSVYKGVNLSLKDLLDQYDDITDDIKKGGKFTFVYKSKDPIQGWSSDKENVKMSIPVSPYLSMIMNKYKKGNGNPKELLNQLNEVSVPVIIELRANSDDLLIKGEFVKYLSNDKDDLFRVNNQPTSVIGIIPEPLLGPVHEILTSIRRLYKNK